MPTPLKPEPPFLPPSRRRPLDAELAAAIEAWIAENPAGIRAQALRKLLDAQYASAQ